MVQQPWKYRDEILVGRIIEKKKRERRNFITKILELVSISLGSKTSLNNVVELEEKAIIGHFLRYKMSHK